MTRARDIANLGTQAGSGLDASDITSGVLPVGVTGGSGLDLLSINLSASGGTTIYTEGDYKVHVYKSSSTFVMGAKSGNVQYLIVAGGGGSGGWQGTGVGPNGAGGAGGVVAGSVFFSASITYTVTVGNGGAAISSDIPGNRGGMSQITGVDMFFRAIGGGGGGDTSNNGLDGGCGGGGGENALPFPTISSQGFMGGTTSSNSCSGGGGGAGAVGVNATSTVAGNGGIGYLTTIIAHANATTEGVGEVDSSNVYFSGGGGGGKRYAGTAGTGGLGGGGNGSVDGMGNDGTNYTGGGGGAGGGNTNTNAKAGGHGCVILRYKFQ